MSNIDVVIKTLIENEFKKISEEITACSITETMDKTAMLVMKAYGGCLEGVKPVLTGIASLEARKPDLNFFSLIKAEQIKMLDTLHTATLADGQEFVRQIIPIMDALKEQINAKSK